MLLLDAYNAVIADGGSISDAASAGMEAAASVMTAAGAPPEMVELWEAATEGINNAIESGASPAEAFNMAGESVDAMGDMGPETCRYPGGEFGPPPGDMGPPPGDMGPGPDGPMGLPPGDMGPGPDGPMGPPPGDMGPGPDGPMGQCLQVETMDQDQIHYLVKVDQQVDHHQVNQLTTTR